MEIEILPHAIVIRVRDFESRASAVTTLFGGEEMRALTDNPWIREKVLQGCWAQVALCGQGMSLFRKQRVELIETLRLFVQ
jgi:hypothetical protein